MIKMNEIPPCPEVKEANELNEYQGFDVNDTFKDYFQVVDTPSKAMEINEAREYKVEECAAITHEYFPLKVMDEWHNYSVEQRKEICQNYVKDISKEMGVPLQGIVFEPMERSYGYNNGDGYIHINEAIVRNPAEINRLIDTMAHETRHQFQKEAINNPEAFHISEATAAEWAFGFAIYSDRQATQYDPWGYYYNPVEIDARYFGEQMVRENTQQIVMGEIKEQQGDNGDNRDLASNMELKSSKYDDNEWNIKAMEECLRRGDLGNAKKHAGRIHK